jgi:hypothetical protein
VPIIQEELEFVEDGCWDIKGWKLLDEIIKKIMIINKIDIIEDEKYELNVCIVILQK